MDSAQPKLSTYDRVDADPYRRAAPWTQEPYRWNTAHLQQQCARIHNYGGRIKQDFVPSTQMRRWAWAQYHETKNEKFRQMALAKRIKRTIVIPARPFVGDHPRVHELVAEVVSNRLRIEREQGVIAQELQRFNSKT